MLAMSAGPLVLVAEDEALIGMDVCDALETTGDRVVGPLATTPEGLACIERDRRDLAILDLTLRDGPSLTLAAELRR